MTGAYPLRTERLVLRSLQPQDVDVLVAYRNDPQVSALQDWELPYTQEQAWRLVARQWIDIAPGAPTQIAIERGSELIGDVYVGIDEHGGIADIGYTFTVANQGKGYALEAVSAVVDDLIDRLGVHRVTAELSKDNDASIRLLERLGMTFEYFAETSFWWRGAWDDNLHYAMTAVQRRAWRERPRSSPTTVRLVPITRDNQGAYRRLCTHRSQESFVGGVEQSYADALFPWEEAGQPVVAILLGIEADGEPVGFLMYADVPPGAAEPTVWRLLVDRRHQGRGIGRTAMSLLHDRLQSAGHAAVRVAWLEGRGSPGPFFLRLGYVPTGETDNDAAIARLVLSAPGWPAVRLRG